MGLYAWFVCLVSLVISVLGAGACLAALQPWIITEQQGSPASIFSLGTSLQVPPATAERQEASSMIYGRVGESFSAINIKKNH